MTRRLAIVGGGILGLSVARQLLRAGVAVDLYERSPELGGLMGSIDLAGYRADRFYHVVLPSDDRVIGLAEELELGDAWRFRSARTGFFDAGRLLSVTTVREFLTFPAFPLRDRLRLGLFVARCQRRSTHDDLDRRPLVPWLREQCGARVVDRMWRPLLESKFDGAYDDLPATYMWARTRRVSGMRSEGPGETLGTLRGGYQTMIDALVDDVVRLGGGVHVATHVERVARAEGGGIEVRLADGVRSYDAALLTLLPPQVAPLLDDELRAALPVDRRRYLGVVCLVLRLGRSLSPYYTLNLTDRRVPLTGVIETTHVVDPEEAGGHLVYVPRYVDPSSPDLTAPADEVEARYLADLRQIFPDLRDEDVLASSLQRARLVEPVHTIAAATAEPDPTFIAPGLALASSALVYPEIVNGQSVLGVAARTSDALVEELCRKNFEPAPAGDPLHL